MAKRFLLVLNSVVVVLSILLFVLCYVPPSKQFFLVGFTVLTPLAIVLNIFFVVFWLLRLDKRVLVSLGLLLFFNQHISSFFSIHTNKNSKDKAKQDTRIKLASFNTHYFRNQDRDPANSNNCFNLFEAQGVDVIGLQESNFTTRSKSYKHTNYKGAVSSQSWIYSRSEVVGSGVVDIVPATNSRKDLTYIDVKISNQIIRVYNLHLQSFYLPKKADQLQKSGFRKLVKRFSLTFKIQENEINSIIKHIKESPYPVVVMGDFNNNAYSYPYTQLIKQCRLKDTFVDAGNGFGATFDFNYFPTRIDFILVPDTAKVFSHQVITKKTWSDHFPVIAEISL